MRKLTEFDGFKFFAAFSIAMTIDASMAFAADPTREIWIRSPDVSQNDLEIRVRASGGLTLSEFFEQQRPDPASDTRIAKLLEQAQRKWLAGDLEGARTDFAALANLALDADWLDAQREALLYAFMRLAQSSSTPLERDEWLKKAVLTVQELEPESDLFPPPLIKSYFAVRERVESSGLPFWPRDHFPEARILLINGRRIDLDSDRPLKLPPAFYRITAISDAHAPVTERLSRSQLELFRLQPPSLVSGTCDLPESMTTLQSEVARLKVLFVKDCTRTLSHGQWLAKDPALAEIQKFNESAFAARNTNRNWLPDSFHETDFNSARVEQRSKWLWLGASALVAGGIYLAQVQMRSRSGNQPAHHAGF